MDCETFREALLGDPAAPGTPEMDAHEAACTACAAYADRARRAEALIAEALRFDVAETRAASVGSAHAVREDSRPTSWLSAGLAATVAAVVVMTLGRGVGVVPNPGPELTALASEVAEHWNMEPHSWVVTGYRAPDNMVSQVLDGKANLATDSLPPISYVHSCYFRGQWVQGKCGEGKCGGDKGEAEGKCGEGKCGGEG